MTPEQVAIVQRTAAMVEQDGDRFARAFYDHLFERRPSARCLFPEDLDLQRSRLVEEILLLVAAAADLPSFLERARELGRRHQGYGVHADDYPFVGDALVAAVAVVAADQWSPEAEAAWRRTYVLISEAMLEGGASRAVHRPGLSRARRPLAPGGGHDRRVEPAAQAFGAVRRRRRRPPGRRSASGGVDEVERRLGGEQRRAEPLERVDGTAASRPGSAAAMPAGVVGAGGREVALHGCPPARRGGRPRPAARPNRTASCSSMTSSAKAPRARALAAPARSTWRAASGPPRWAASQPSGAVPVAPEQAVVVGPELRDAVDVAAAAVGIAAEESGHADERQHPALGAERTPRPAPRGRRARSWRGRRPRRRRGARCAAGRRPAR